MKKLTVFHLIFFPLYQMLRITFQQKFFIVITIKTTSYIVFVFLLKKYILKFHNIHLTVFRLKSGIIFIRSRTLQ